MNKITIIKTALILLMVLTSILSTGCAVDEWTLVEGVLTDIQEIKGRYALTFDQTRVVLLKYGYDLEIPAVLVLNQYYYLYKENADAAWNGSHLVKNEH